MMTYKEVLDEADERCCKQSLTALRRIGEIAGSLDSALTSGILVLRSDLDKLDDLVRDLRDNQTRLSVIRNLKTRL